MHLRFRATLTTDVGLVRAKNEDSAFAGSQLIVVADGMGGMPAGEFASDIVIRRMQDLDAYEGSEPLTALLDAIAASNDEIAAAAQEAPDRYGMGTTVTAMLANGVEVALAHVGDSRAYLLRDGEFSQVTSDDTYVQMLVDRGELTREEARNHPQRALVTQALQGRVIDPYGAILLLRADDRVLICSDGLSDYVDDDAIAEVLRSSQQAGDAGAQLVKLAYVAGAPDNVTAVIADVFED
jgi:PPM family protein phosphatase